MQAIDTVNQLEPELLKELAVLNFQLQSARYKQALCKNNTEAALEILQTVITPLVQECGNDTISVQAEVCFICS